MKYIYVGFKGKNNPSFYIVSKFQESFFLTNSYLGIDRDIKKIKDCKDGILLFGLKPKLYNKIQIELVSKFNNKELKPRIDFSKLNQVFKEVEVVYNEKPTAYLCNYAYYRLLEKFNGNVILIHVPFSKEYAEQIISCLKEEFSVEK
ncbi:MAG: hypothetical protein K2K48_06740 [Anaeroplasmataceae bacterium]|nr:hypothetical protein [Anaeroplasmataceae bacterium]MDE6415096.1 hypothetical protein [Anaeroplasmataceae bacterium]